MRFLILGGTAWVGHAVASTARDAGHQVTCVARGIAVPHGVSLVRADRDQDDALTTVAASSWDVVVDVARHPVHVRRAVRDLGDAADRFVFVSTASVYASQAEIGADEDAVLLAPLARDMIVSPEDYGPAKVAGENAVMDRFSANRAVIIRPGLIGGPGDPSGRTGYWPLRFASPSNPRGDVLVPNAPDLLTAVIDVRDLAGWIVRLAEAQARGTFNALGDPVPFADHIEVARLVAGHTGRVVKAADDWLVERGVAEWSGPRSLPLWLADRTWYGMNARSTARAGAAGLIRRPLSETVADSLAWAVENSVGIAQGAGLSNEDERELLAELA